MAICLALLRLQSEFTQSAGACVPEVPDVMH